MHLDGHLYINVETVAKRKRVCVNIVSDKEIELCSVHFDNMLTMLTIHLLSACDRLPPASAVDWFKHVMCYHVYVIMHVKYPSLSVVRVGHFVPLAGFCPSLCEEDGM